VEEIEWISLLIAGGAGASCFDDSGWRTRLCGQSVILSQPFRPGTSDDYENANVRGLGDFLRVRVVWPVRRGAAGFRRGLVKPTSSRSADFRVLPGGRLEITGVNLNIIIREAFHLKRYQISGGPGWLGTDEFDIVAKAEGDPSRERILEMLQTLLAERFKLKVHRRTGKAMCTC